ncbi:unnamed protein product [Mycena citricolor]|uniref:Uncharacterized protein n=1 Tax=Mycena citricolor TaxID=2018698 RepID=A0AAD2JU59_9AGAR|nr:unnamed protein product [Mycena citricolor]
MIMQLSDPVHGNPRRRSSSSLQSWKCPSQISSHARGAFSGSSQVTVDDKFVTKLISERQLWARQCFFRRNSTTQPRS